MSLSNYVHCESPLLSLFLQETLTKFEERVSYFTEETSVLQWIVEIEAKLASFAEEGGSALTEEEEKSMIAALEALRTEVVEFKTRMIDFEIKHTENVMGKFMGLFS